jgi:hypothetical protein
LTHLHVPISMLEDFLFYVYLLIVAATCVTGFIRYRRLDKGTRVILAILVLTIISEGLSALGDYFIYYKSYFYHVFNLLQLMLITTYFANTIKFRNKGIIAIVCLFYVVLEVLNDIFFQPLTKLNTNFISLECLLIVPMALYSLFRILIDDSIEKLQTYVHFWLWTILLLLFSSSFFFWQFVVYFYKHNELFYNISNYIHQIANLILYTGIFLVFLYYPKMVRDES